MLLSFLCSHMVKSCALLRTAAMTTPPWMWQVTASQKCRRRSQAWMVETPSMAPTAGMSWSISRQARMWMCLRKTRIFRKRREGTAPWNIIVSYLDWWTMGSSGLSGTTERLGMGRIFWASFPDGSPEPESVWSQEDHWTEGSGDGWVGRSLCVCSYQ